ncbi:MAG: Structural component of the gap junctions, partial [Paramarteilia canceri]
TPAYTQFTEDYCWALNTYALHDIGESNEVFDTDERLITYYQWAPLILLLSIILILIPNCLWKGFAPSYRKFPEIARNFSLSLNSEQQNQLVKKATRIVEDVIIHTTKPAELSYIYLGIKCTIIIVLLMEIMLYRTILGPKHFFNIFVPGSRGTTLNERFPLVTQCFVTVYVSRDNGVNEVPA